MSVNFTRICTFKKSKLTRKTYTYQWIHSHQRAMFYRYTDFIRPCKHLLLVRGNIADESPGWKISHLISQSYQLLLRRLNILVIFQKGNIMETLNTMTKTIKYISTKPTVAKKLKSLLLQEPVKTVERQMNQDTTNDHDRKRNEKQLKNIMYTIIGQKTLFREQMQQTISSK